MAEVAARLEPLASSENRAGMARYGIRADRALGVPLSVLRPLSREMAPDHALAAELWRTGVREYRLLASFIEEPERVTPAQMDAWAADFDSWDVVDGVCDLFVRTPYVEAKIAEWADAEPEFVRRAGFVLIARRAVSDKAAPDSAFLSYLPIIRRHSTDGRNSVKKAVNWALRQIGKRSAALRGPALRLAQELAAAPDPTARWIGRNAVRELAAKPVAQCAG